MAVATEGVMVLNCKCPIPSSTAKHAHKNISLTATEVGSDKVSHILNARYCEVQCPDLFSCPCKRKIW